MPAALVLHSAPDSLTSNGIKPVPRTQSSIISTETDANDDDNLSLRTVDGLIRQRARMHPDAHVVSYPSSGIEFVDYTIQQLDVFAWRVSKHFESRLPVRSSSDEKPAVVALLGPSNLEYLITKLAIIKLGHSALLLSTRIPQPAIESILNVTGSLTILADARYIELAGQVRRSMPAVQVMEIPKRDVFEFPIDAHGNTRLDSHLNPEVEKDNIAFIIHSSGSTGLPKPIYQSQKACLANYATSMEMKAFITLPLFHNHGICNLFRAIWCLKPIYLYNADLPLTQDYLVRIMRKYTFEIFYGVPYALKLLSESEEGIQLLQMLKIVMYGGSACPDDLGNMLVNHGVNLVGHYGATEVGQLMTSFRPPGDKDWNYVRESEKLSPFLRWVPQGNNLFECIVRDGWPAKVQSNRPDGSYATRDLFEPHPTITKAWKYIARLDDTLVLVNGEKLNPVAMEGQIRSDRNVAEAVVFGAGRPNLGVLVVPAPRLAGKSNEEILEAVWPTIDQANKSVDSFGRISKNMVRLLPTDCSYPRTDKGSIIRQAFCKAFKAEIDETYDAQDVGTGELKTLELAQMRQFLHGLLSSTTSDQTKFEDDTDFFLLGLDSLQAIQLRSEILRTVELGGKLGQNVVFENPSIDKLAKFLDSLRRGEDAASTAVETEMQALIDKYGDIGATPASSVVVTGATGSLGAHVVTTLASNPEITTIFCLVRAPTKSQALIRVKESLIQRCLYHSLSLTSRHKIVALPCDLSDPKLGLSAQDYQAVAQDLRCIIHCAWSVNFNMHLSSFEKGDIAGVNHLLALVKASPTRASMNFCSSVSSCSRATQSPVPESLPDLAWAQGMGYAQSKSVAEHVCARAAAAGIPARVLRVGQIVGDTKHGVWNAQEAVPMMMQTAVTVGALPRLAETPSWLPVDTVAEAVVDMSLSDKKCDFANITHHKTFSWTDDLLPALRLAGLQFDEVGPKEWVSRLRASNPDPKANPPIKLVDFFASKYDTGESAPSKTFATDVARSLAPALANAPVLEPGFVKLFVRYFLDNCWGSEAEEQKAVKTAVFMAGPCGSGKTTAGASIASWLGVPFVEGDALHTRAAVDMMRAHTALSDNDRKGWLGRVCSHARETVCELDYSAVVVSCSALKASYRAHIRETLGRDGVRAVFVDLQAGRDVLVKRMEARKGHYMGAQMVDGQLEVYEAAGQDEMDVLPVDAEADQEEVVDEVKWILNKVVGLPGGDFIC
ncbi:NRPS-like enzyme [Cordyceps militaris CM01]|uniref:gluconokinase n=1 Tax=Cordyceps militaris (strain CM01) TaxID=983644 RepID=G3JHL4_CORMM|nr:NRPS-like enzyme [Cordyceps militaris CM01]EGX90922.1 NRPS-like enzyme [Cordyceps militaris CM01]